jgi:hypothetical protein
MKPARTNPAVLGQSWLWAESLLGHMTTSANFHMRALGCAVLHFTACAFLGAFVWMYFLADGWFNQGFEPLSWWLSTLYWL